MRKQKGLLGQMEAQIIPGRVVFWSVPGGESFEMLKCKASPGQQRWFL